MVHIGVFAVGNTARKERLNAPGTVQASTYHPLSFTPYTTSI